MNNPLRSPSLLSTGLFSGLALAVSLTVSAASPETESAPGLDAPPLNALGESIPEAALALSESTSSALAIDLRGNQAFLLRKGGDGELAVASRHFVSFGKGGLDKMREGDEKTPIGVYFVQRHLLGEGLPPIYGAGALPLDYPNVWDKRLERTGSGIWIHGSDRSLPDLPPQVSRGCLAFDDRDFLEVLDGVEVGQTPVIIAEQLQWRSAVDLRTTRQRLEKAVERWREDWESLDVERYLRHYADDFRSGSMSRDAFETHKRRVASGRNWIQVGIEDLELYRYPGEEDLYLARFRQRYRSESFRADSVKVQFWRESEDGWTIVQEGRG